MFLFNIFLILGDGFMSLVKLPVKGMRDFLPDDMQLREYVLNVMWETYESFGFEMVGTPSVEHIENLTSKQGGENEKLIFKIMKRGDKLANFDGSVSSLVDCGLRYDLTVPLARLYANNMNSLGYPFRSFQKGYSYRAERPQRGRFRELMQCDLDIIGESSNLAEIELMVAVISFLKKLSFDGFKIVINDRRILRGMIDYVNIPLAKMDDVLIVLDKFDKIGLDGICQELELLGIDSEVISKLKLVFSNSYDLRSFCSSFAISDDIVSNLEEIISNVCNNVDVSIVFDPTLVRGMGYYTGPIFEIKADGLASSIGGGGRYDEMIGNFANVSVSACGFSIGFERLIMLLKERGFVVPLVKKKLCYVLASDVSVEEKSRVIKLANEMRSKGNIVKIVFKQKNFKHQKDNLLLDGYEVIM